MALLASIAFILLAAIAASPAETTLGPGPSEFFDHIEILSETTNEFILFWKHNETQIVFEVHAKTPHWLVFGLGPDLITTWLNGDIGHFSSQPRGLYSPLALTRIGPYLVVKFVRSFNLCSDTPYRDLSGQLSVVFGLGQEQPVSLAELRRGEVNLQISGYSHVPQCLSSGSVAQRSLGENARVLVEDKLWLYWKGAWGGKFRAELHVRAVGGWALLGFGREGRARQADVVVVGWGGEVVDGFVYDDGRIVADASQDWRLLDWRESDGVTVYKLERDVVLCEPDDLVIQVGPRHYEVLTTLIVLFFYFFSERFAICLFLVRS